MNANSWKFGAPGEVIFNPWRNPAHVKCLSQPQGQGEDRSGVHGDSAVVQHRVMIIGRLGTDGLITNICVKTQDLLFIFQISLRI